MSTTIFQQKNFERMNKVEVQRGLQNSYILPVNFEE